MASITGKRLNLHRDLERRQAENEALKSQVQGLGHLANIGVASYMIAHEINNLLTPIGTYAGLALENPDDVELGKKALGKAARNCERASKIMESMLALANGQNQEKENYPLAELVEEVFACLVRDFSKDGINVDVQISPDLQVWAVPAQIQQLLMNLILNAREAMLGRGGILGIAARSNEKELEITVSDTGVGIAASDLEKIFEPFFTTKKGSDSPSGRLGSGLGLALCKRVVEAHDGTISVQSKPQEGSTFKIVLPSQ
ncbi:MAG: sensor histidine kinase [Planctomycetota bacterium]